MWKTLRKTIRVISFTTLVLLGLAWAYNYLTPGGLQQAEKTRLNPFYVQLMAMAKISEPEAVTAKIKTALDGTDATARDAALRYLEDDSYRHPDDDKLSRGYFRLLRDYYVAQMPAAKDKVDTAHDILRAALTEEALQATDDLRCTDMPAAPDEAADGLKPAYAQVDDMTFDRVVNEAIAFEQSHGARKTSTCTGAVIDDGEWGLRRMAARDKLRAAWQARLKAAKAP